MKGASGPAQGTSAVYTYCSFGNQTDGIPDIYLLILPSLVIELS